MDLFNTYDIQNDTMHLGEIPDWCKNIGIKLQANGIIGFKKLADQWLNEA